MHPSRRFSDSEKRANNAAGKDEWADSETTPNMLRRPKRVVRQTRKSSVAIAKLPGGARFFTVRRTSPSCLGQINA